LEYSIGDIPSRGKQLWDAFALSRCRALATQNYGRTRCANRIGDTQDTHKSAASTQT
jgi:hypothetical protein